MNKKHPLRIAIKINQNNFWLIEALQKEAVRQNRTVNNLIETILIEYFEENKATNEQVDFSDTSDRVESSQPIRYSTSQTSSKSSGA
jgi:hypothetical protein